MKKRLSSLIGSDTPYYEQDAAWESIEQSFKTTRNQSTLTQVSRGLKNSIEDRTALHAHADSSLVTELTKRPSTARNETPTETHSEKVSRGKHIDRHLMEGGTASKSHSSGSSASSVGPSYEGDAEVDPRELKRKFKSQDELFGYWEISGKASLERTACKEREKDGSITHTTTTKPRQKGRKSKKRRQNPS